MTAPAASADQPTSPPMQPRDFAVLTTPAKPALITTADDGQDDEPACRHLLMPIRTAG